MKRGVTLVELLLACAVAAVGITCVLVLAAEVIGAGARVRARNADSAAARVALYRLQNELAASQSTASIADGVALTSVSGGIRWQVVTFDGTPHLTRVKSGSTPEIKNSVAPEISELSLQTSAAARTLAITAGPPGRRAKLTEVIRSWGVTL